MQTFAVSDVSPSDQPLPAIALEDALAPRLGAPSGGEGEGEGDALPGSPRRRRPQRAPVLEACGVNQAHLVRAPGLAHVVHPMIGAVHTAFAKHYPLVLSPDDVWLCLAQGFALHVEADPEALRARFVRHEGQLELQIRRDEFVPGSPDNDWQGCVAEWSDAIAAHIGKKRDLVVASFSTTGPIERAASELVLMSAMQSYFRFRLATLCGIPAITLLGTVDDWRAVRRRAEVFAEFDLADWTRMLLPVLDQFVAAAAGRADRAFWRSIYKYNDGSGGPYVTGWINVLFPRLDDGRSRNGYAFARSRDMDDPLEDTIVEETRFEDAGFEDIRFEDASCEGTSGEGPNPDEFPSGLSHVPLTWQYLETLVPTRLLGGFVGISQDPHTRAVRPAIGWAVQRQARS